jgi:hypothetical protein
MYKICLFIAVALLVIGCSDDSNTKKINYLQNFQGITERDEIGDLIGLVDSTDWNLHEVNGIFDFPQYVEIKSSEDDIVPSPFRFSAYPNPTNYNSASFRINAPQVCEISLWMIDENGNCKAVIIEKETLLEGIHELELNLTNFSSGLYRCMYYLEIDEQTYWGWGDVLKE